MQLESLRDYVFEQLNNHLAPSLYYHGAHHTQYVYDAALKIAEHENVTGEAFEVLMAAILMHDIGFLETYHDHEEKGCEIAQRILPDFGFNEIQIESVCAMIMRTKLPQIAFNKLEEIICDADLDYLGTDDFLPIGNLLYREFKHYEVVKNEEEWNRLQVKFLEAHQYFTGYSKTYREEKKKENLEMIKEIVKNYHK